MENTGTNLFAPKADDFSRLHVVKARVKSLEGVKLRKKAKVFAEFRTSGSFMRQNLSEDGTWAEKAAEFVFVDKPSKVEMFLYTGTDTVLGQVSVDMELEVLVDSTFPLLNESGNPVGGNASLRIEILPMFPNVREQEAWQEALRQKTEKLETLQREKEMAGLEQKRLEGIMQEKADSLYDVERSLRKVQREIRGVQMEKKSFQSGADGQRSDAAGPDMDVSEIKEAEYSTIFVVDATILWAKDLRKADILGKSDPYAEIEVSGVMQKTEVIMKTLDPQWKSNKFRFIFSQLNRPEVAKITVWDWNRRSSPDFLGDLVLPLSEQRIFGWQKLQNTKKGEIQIGLEMHKFSPNENAVKRSKADYFDAVDAIEFTTMTLAKLHRDIDDLKEKLAQREKELQRRKEELEEEQRRLEAERKAAEELRRQAELEAAKKKNALSGGKQEVSAQPTNPSTTNPSQEQNREGREGSGAEEGKAKVGALNVEDPKARETPRKTDVAGKGCCCVIL